MGAREVLITIQGWMADLRRAVMANRLKTGALLALAGLILVSLLITAGEAFGHFSGTVRAVLLVLWVVAALAALGLGLVWPVLRYTLFAPDDKTLARRYAGRMPTVRDRVLNALQLLERAENANREGYSSELILEAGREVAEDLKPLDPRTLPEREPVRRSGKLALATSALAVLLLFLAGRPLLSAAERVMNPGEEYAPPAPFTLEVKPGHAHLVRGDSLVVEVTAAGNVPPAVIIERLEKGKTATEPVEIKGENGAYRYVYRGVTAPFTYWAHAGTVESEKYDVEVEELPGIRFLSVRLAPPAYTHLPDQVLDENVGDIAAVVGTKVRLELSATKTLAEGRLEFLAPASDSAQLAAAAMTPHGRLVERGSQALQLDGSRAAADFAVTESGYYRIHLADREGRRSRDPILYRITARPDEPPLVSIVEPAQDMDIAANVRIGVAAEAVDDFGFSRMNLRYHRTSAFEPAELQADEAQYQTLPLDLQLLEPGKAAAEFVWDMTPLDLLPEDQVIFFVEVWDNDGIRGPKRARSESRTLRFPSMSEIFEEQEQAAEAREISLAELLQESEKIREEVDKAVEEFKSNPEMSWERKQEIEQLMQKQQAMNEVLNQIAEAMDKAQEQMEQRSMFSPQVMEKMQQIQELVQEVITPEMRQALERLAQAMQQPTEEELRRALENFQMTQEMFERALDQTLNMLKQLQLEQKLDELTRRLDELGRQQEQLNEQMDQNTPENSEQNAEQQKKTGEEMKKLERELEKLAEDMKKAESRGQEEMQELQKQAQEQQLSEQMQQNAQAMGMCQNQSAKKKGKQIRREMASMANKMQSIKQQMHQEQMAEVLQKLERARDQLLDLSMRQEKLWKESEQLEAGSPQMAQAAEEQENLRQALSRVNEDMQELAKKTMFASPQLMAGMNRAMHQMSQAGEAAQSRDPRTASHYRQQALGAINQTLKEANSACSACQSACNNPNGNPSMSNSIGMLSERQQQLNSQSQGMMNNNPGALSMGEQAAMQRMAAEQRGLAKSAEQLAAEAKASQQSLGDLQDVAREMEEVAKDLENRNLSQRTVEKQEHIESRLLDFQRANREKEFSPKRRAHTGQDIVRSSPRPLPARPGIDQLREDLLRALDAKYTPDYEQLIRAYFDALSKWK